MILAFAFFAASEIRAQGAQYMRRRVVINSLVSAMLIISWYNNHMYIKHTAAAAAAAAAKNGLSCLRHTKKVVREYSKSKPIEIGRNYVHKMQEMLGEFRRRNVSYAKECTRSSGCVCQPPRYRVPQNALPL